MYTLSRCGIVGDAYSIFRSSAGNHEWSHTVQPSPRYSDEAASAGGWWRLLFDLEDLAFVELDFVVPFLCDFVVGACVGGL
jgi:hypothetical protein